MPVRDTNFMRALRGEPTDRIPFWEVWFAVTGLDAHLMGKPVETFDDQIAFAPHNYAEVIGAARVLSRRAGVTALRYLVDEGAGSDAWLLRRVTQASHKPVEQLTVREVARDADLAGVFLNLSVD